jgi:hypothetical protein
MEQQKDTKLSTRLISLILKCTGLVLAYESGAGHIVLWLREFGWLIERIKINFRREFGRYQSAVIDLLVANSRADRFIITGLIVKY